MGLNAYVPPKALWQLRTSQITDERGETPAMRHGSVAQSRRHGTNQFNMAGCMCEVLSWLLLILLLLLRWQACNGVSCSQSIRPRLSVTTPCTRWISCSPAPGLPWRHSRRACWCLWIDRDQVTHAWALPRHSSAVHGTGSGAAGMLWPRLGAFCRLLRARCRPRAPCCVEGAALRSLLGPPLS